MCKDRMKGLINNAMLDRKLSCLQVAPLACRGLRGPADTKSRMGIPCCVRLLMPPKLLNTRPTPSALGGALGVRLPSQDARGGWQ